MHRNRRLLHTALDSSLVEPLFDWSRSTATSIEAAPTAIEALNWIKTGPYDLLITGTEPNGLTLEQFIEEALRTRPELPVVLLAQSPDYREAMHLARLGVSEYLPWDPRQGESVAEGLGRLATALEAARQRREENTPDDGVPLLVGRSEAIRAVSRLIHLIAPRRATVLITGRTGTGKELVARAVHAASPRAERPMVMVNCGAVPGNLMEAEFFGHVKGAFTGAVANRVGRFEQADGGDIFLDEIGEMPVDLQSKLLRVLQEREFERVGSSETVKVDVRVLAATNCDLKELVERGQFREDLYYRLNVVPVQLPSLAERREDIPLLAEHLLDRVCTRERLPRKRPGPEAVDRLLHCPWPGNVRQLENAIENAVVLSGARTLLYPSDFPLLPAPRAPSTVGTAMKLPPEGLDFETTVSRMERSLLQQALERTAGNKKRAADLLRIKRTTFSAKWRTLQERVEI